MTPIQQTSRAATAAAAAWVAVLAWLLLRQATIGIESNDGGFVLGLAHDLAQGKELYTQAFYIRPPLTVYLHAWVFLLPPDWPLLLLARLVAGLELAIASLVPILMMRRLFALGGAETGILALVSLIAAFHNYPLMPWHTIDGLCLAALSLALGSVMHRAPWRLAAATALLAVAAVGTKQNFLTVPLLVALAVTLSQGGQMALRLLVCLALATVVGAALVAMAVDVSTMLAATRSMTHTKHIWLIGAVGFGRDFLSTWSVLTVVPTIVLVLWCGMSTRPLRHIGLLALASLAVLPVGLAFFFAVGTKWQVPEYLPDALFPATLSICLVKVIRRAGAGWVWLLALHGLAWTVSISWGYATTALLPAPMILTVWLVLRTIVPAAITRVLAILLPAGFLAAYFVGQNYLYDIEAPDTRATNTQDMGQVSPLLAGIRGTQADVELYRQTCEAIEALGPRTIVIPNMPLSYAICGRQNPIGMGWLATVETAPYDKVLRRQITSGISFAVFNRAAARLASRPTLGGSVVSMDIAARWIEVSSPWPRLAIFRNPSLKVGTE